MKTAQYSSKPEVFVLNDGVYECSSCVPPVKVKADGIDHKVAGHPYYDSVAVKVVDAHTIQETDKKAGKTVTTSTNTVAPDSKTMTFEFTDSSNTNAAPVTGKGVETRNGAMPPAGAHAISGSWRITSFSGYSDNGLTTTYEVSGDSLSMSSPTGQKYTAKLDGTPAPMTGDPGVTTVSVKKLADNEIVETDMRGAKTIGKSTMTVAKDGKTMHVVYDNVLQGSTMSFTNDKQ